MDVRIKDGFSEIWMLYKRYYDDLPTTDAGWDKLLAESKQINDKYEMPIITDFICAVLKDLDHEH